MSLKEGLKLVNSALIIPRSIDPEGVLVLANLTAPRERRPPPASAVSRGSGPRIAVFPMSEAIAAESPGSAASGGASRGVPGAACGAGGRSSMRPAAAWRTPSTSPRSCLTSDRSSATSSPRSASRSLMRAPSLGDAAPRFSSATSRSSAWKPGVATHPPTTKTLVQASMERGLPSLTVRRSCRAGFGPRQPRCSRARPGAPRSPTA